MSTQTDRYARKAKPTRRTPSDEFPTGWFQVAWGPELAVGEVLPLRYFGTDLVAYRGFDGAVRVFDANCAHLGAHLGYGGRVEGNDIRCPFHGWLWSSTGENLEIPYSGKERSKRCIRVWHVAEVGALVMVWNDARQRPPLWDPPAIPEFDDDDRYPAFPACTGSWLDQRFHPQFVVENTVDLAHQKYIHQAAEVPTMDSWEPDGPVFRARQLMVFGQGKKSTWLTPQGTYDGSLNITVSGIGLIETRFDVDRSVHIMAQTPVELDSCDLRATVLVNREPDDTGVVPTGKAERRVRYGMREVERDLPIWQHMVFIDPPSLAPEEGQIYTAFRRWAKQFYPGEE